MITIGKRTEIYRGRERVDGGADRDKGRESEREADRQTHRQRQRELKL